ncbi:MAG: TonB-dependent receptor, partial [Sphingobium phenoxybenzoativorans]
LDWDVGFATLTSATSYNELESPFRTDITALLSAAVEPIFGPNEGIQKQTTKYDKVTQALRLASPAGERLDWMAGAHSTKE